MVGGWLRGWPMKAGKGWSIANASMCMWSGAFVSYGQVVYMFSRLGKKFEAFEGHLGVRYLKGGGPYLPYHHTISPSCVFHQDYTFWVVSCFHLPSLLNTLSLIKFEKCPMTQDNTLRGWIGVIYLSQQTQLPQPIQISLLHRISPKSSKT